MKNKLLLFEGFVFEVPMFSIAFGYIKSLIEIQQLNGCRIAAESPQRSEDLQRIAGTKAEQRSSAHSPKYSFNYQTNTC